MPSSTSPGPPSGSLPSGLRRAWGIADPAPGRGPKASLSVDVIVGTAVTLGDAEGIGGVSLTKVAGRLGVTPNALYRYLDSRDELHLLAAERAIGTPGPVPESPRWQDRTVVWAHALRARYAEHPWLADLAIRLPLAPNALAWFEVLLDALRSAPLELADKVRTAVLLDGFVRASAVAARDLATGGAPLDEGHAAMPAMGELLARRGLTQVAEVLASGLYQEPPDRTNDADFRFGLDRIIAGIDALASRPSQGA